MRMSRAGDSLLRHSFQPPASGCQRLETAGSKMTDLLKTIDALLVRELEGFKREILMFDDDESLWRALPGITNPAGNLAMHVAGGLQHFVGRVLGGSGYV